MSNASFEGYPGTFISLPLFALLYTFILYLLYRPCPSFPLGSDQKEELVDLVRSGLEAKRDYPREAKRDRRCHLQQHPRKQSDTPCMPSVNRWDSVFAAMFNVIRQTLAQRPWRATPGARNGEGRMDESWPCP